MANAQYAARGTAALEAHKALVEDDGVEFFTAVTDLLTDLLHAAKGERNPRTGQRAVPEQLLREALNLAEMNYEAERG